MQIKNITGVPNSNASLKYTLHKHLAKSVDYVGLEHTSACRWNAA